MHIKKRYNFFRRFLKGPNRSGQFILQFEEAKTTHAQVRCVQWLNYYIQVDYAPSGEECTLAIFLKN
jgi:hypothetical protein